MTSKGYEPFGPLHTPKDDGWGLSWSERWHFIRDAKIQSNGSFGNAVAVCGAQVYTQEEIKTRAVTTTGYLRHLLAAVEGRRGAATCKKCLRWIERDET